MSVLSQRDPKWAGVPLGYGPATIGEAGCLLTSFAQVLRHFGRDVTPLDLNKQLMSQNRFVQGDLLADSAISGFVPGLSYVTRWDFSNRPADLSVLTNNFEDEYVIEIDSDHNPRTGLQMHFVRFVSWDGHTLVIDDPWYGEECDFVKHYGTDLATTIQKIVKYTGPSAAPGMQLGAPVAASSTGIPAMTPLTINLHAHPMGAKVHVSPDVNAELAKNPSIPSGILNGGQQFNVIGYLTGADGQVWYVTIHHNYVRQDATKEGVGPVGGHGEVEAAEQVAEEQVETAAVETATDEPTGQAEGAVPIQTSSVPAEEEDFDEIEVPRTELGREVELKIKVNEDVLAEHGEEGALVYDITTLPVEATEIIAAGEVLPFVAYVEIDGHNYFQTQHIIDEGLGLGIDGLDLQFPEQKEEPVEEVTESVDQPEPEVAAAPEAPKTLKRGVKFLDHLSGTKKKGNE